MARTPKRGRRSGRPDTRAGILAAARRRFVKSGFRGASMRAIAADAGVDPALVHHYFGSKQQLYERATAQPYDGDPLLDVLDAARPGEALVTAFLNAWDAEPGDGSSLAAIMRSAADGDAAEETLLRLVSTTVIAPAVASSDRRTPMPKLRAHLIAAQLCGLAWLRYVHRIEPVASASPALLAKAYGPALDLLLTGVRGA